MSDTALFDPTELAEHSDLVDQASDWGTTVSEATPKKTPVSRMFMIAALMLLGLGSILVIPVLAGSILFQSSGAILEVLIIGLLLIVAFTFKKKSQNLPRNSMQLDYKANELRLGSELPNGLFMREQVVSFRDIDEVSVIDDGPAICLQIPGELVTMRFNGADKEKLEDLASKITAARDTALRAPIRSRIQSRVMGFEASFREAKQRIRTKIVTRSAN